MERTAKRGSKLRCGFASVFGCQDLRSLIFSSILSVNQLYTHVHAARDIASFAVAVGARQDSDGIYGIGRWAIEELWEVLAASCPQMHPLLTPATFEAISTLEREQLEIIVGALFPTDWPKSPKNLAFVRDEAASIVKITSSGVPLKLLTQVRHLRTRMIAPLNACRTYSLSLQELQPITRTLFMGQIHEQVGASPALGENCTASATLVRRDWSIPACRLLDVIELANAKSCKLDCKDSNGADPGEHDEFFLNFLLSLDASSLLTKQRAPHQIQVACNMGAWFGWDDALELAKLRAWQVWRSWYDLRSLPQAIAHRGIPPPLHSWLVKNWAKYSVFQCGRKCFSTCSMQL
eukprot:jgi/Botrbrau1/6101/Bobra.177_1s0038.1